MALPEKLQSALWSYNLAKMDKERDRETIITQVFNHGRWEQVQWVMANYSEEEIKEVVKSPQCGSWMPDSLNYWTKIFNLKLPKRTYQEALFSLKPEKDLNLPKSNVKLRDIIETL